MSEPFIRILSDIHYGDRASRVRSLPPLRPLLAGVGELVLNGDTLDTRPSSQPEVTAATRAEVLEFFGREVPRVTYLTGNHDADFTNIHSLDLAGGAVFVTHGDILFDDIVPWSQDAPAIARLLAPALAAATPEERARLESRLIIYRRVAALMPQRHQVEKRALAYALRFAADTIWPPTRAWHILSSWRRSPGLAAQLLRTHRPQARIILTGHTHRPGLWTEPDGIQIVNTGSFCPPLGGLLGDLYSDRLVIRRIVFEGGEFRPGEIIREIPLAVAAK